MKVKTSDLAQIIAQASYLSERLGKLSLLGTVLLLRLMFLVVYSYEPLIVYLV